MKNILLLLLVLFPLWGLGGCNKNDDDPKNPLGQLPPATQTGEQTFGCLINGEAFIPDTFGSGRSSAFYQLVDGKYTFVVSSSSGNGNSFIGIGIGGIDVPSLVEDSYVLKEEQTGSTFGKIIKVINSYTTSETNQGVLQITHFDPQNYIISGTFEFTVFDGDNNEIKITDGRFDLVYTN